MRSVDFTNDYAHKIDIARGNNNSRNQLYKASSTFENGSGFQTAQKPGHKHSKSFLKLDLASKIDNANQSINKLADIRKKREAMRVKPRVVQTNTIVLENKLYQNTVKARDAKLIGRSNEKSGSVSITNKYRQRKALLGLSGNIPVIQD